MVGPATVRPTSVQDFNKGLRLPLDMPLTQSPPRVRVSRVPVENLVPRRNDKLAAKSVYRDPQPEKQAKRVMVVASDTRRLHRHLFSRDILGAVVFIQAHGNAGTLPHG